MISNDTLRQMFESVVRAAEEKFYKGTFTPVVFVVYPQGIIEIPAFDRTSMRMAVQASLLKFKGVAVITVLEGWAAMIPLERAKELMNIAPSKHPSAKEIVVVTLESKTLKQGVLWDIEGEGIIRRLVNKKTLGGGVITAAAGSYFDEPLARA